MKVFWNIRVVEFCESSGGGSYALFFMFRMFFIVTGLRGFGECIFFLVLF